MSQLTKVTLLPLILNLCLVLNAKSQNLIVTLKNTNTQTYLVSSIQNIKFTESTMILKEKNQTVTSWNISDIDNYSFDNVTTGSMAGTDIQGGLLVYPTPATDVVKIEFNTSVSTSIQIKIIDLQGREIEKIYSGVHLGSKTYEWNSANYNGAFYCQILSNNTVITKPILIQK